MNEEKRGKLKHLWVYAQFSLTCFHQPCGGGGGGGGACKNITPVDPKTLQKGTEWEVLEALLCNLSYNKTRCTRGRQSNVSLNPKNLVLATYLLGMGIQVNYIYKKIEKKERSNIIKVIKSYNR